MNKLSVTDKREIETIRVLHKFKGHSYALDKAITWMKESPCSTGVAQARNQALGEFLGDGKVLVGAMPGKRT